MLISHTDDGYADVLNGLIASRDARRYLEIGVSKGDNLAAIRVDTAIGVDPNFRLNVNVAAGKNALHLFQQSSDAFFQSGVLERLAPEGVDLAFLDGMHLFEFLLRDFANAERRSRGNSLIAMHDCFPLNAEMTERVHAFETRKDKTFAGWWTGDVWKIIPILRKYRPDLVLKGVKSPPTGLLFATNLDPRSDALFENYLRIVTEFKAVENSEDNLRAAYEQVEFVEARALRGFDHSLHFAL
ncbi:hypothetical protein SAMN06265338_10929 [Rhodoblastus acidophilus]|uniref:Class I SAM-dependent methyltransferase n=1 Tax=Rhodoblastus acidophilus TaxID=1074 RepID=A0A212RYW7_RHOAC|nr:class I SAM-dependent methyltransferase [Rhodoblastus acidophilus]RAI17676.1 hypothetical protein CH337_15960 [Rhodoblastus acidophilus]SNB77984.1 hypothetical protein SAMN06265338_10929 [Rhodoblastus acidophilus]